MPAVMADTPLSFVPAARAAYHEKMLGGGKLSAERTVVENSGHGESDVRR